jgi:endonuclease/exonuclease/phosphatase family metal-dependent hydrolase
MNLANGGAGLSGMTTLLDALQPDVVAVQELVPPQAELLARLFQFGKLDPSSDFTGMGIALRHPANIWRLPMPYRDAFVAEISPPGWTGNGRPIEIVNVHIAAPHAALPWRTLARRRGQLRALEAHLDLSTRPRAVVGDLNATPMWPVYRRLRARLADAAVEASRHRGAPPARTWGPGPGTPRLLRIDHALVQEMRVLDVQVHPIPGSDHSALLVDITPE